MSTGNAEIFGSISNLINTPAHQDTINEVGGIITNTGLIWPVDDSLNGDIYYYDINVLSQEVFLLPYLDSDAEDAIQITNQNEILALVTSIHVFIKIVSSLKILLRNENPVLAACLAQNPKNIPFFIATSLS